MLIKMDEFIFVRAKLCPHPMPWLLTSEVCGGQGWPMSQGCLLIFRESIVQIELEIFVHLSKQSTCVITK